MTKLSVNINKIALIRNARGRNYPSVEGFSERFLQLGAHGITLHPRPDQRHAKYSDIPLLAKVCQTYGAELNIEGYPCPEFMTEVLKNPPTQCTLVPDAPNQITSDHGWQILNHTDLLAKTITQLKTAGIRVSLFVDMDCPLTDLTHAKALGADRVELYTEPYAQAFEQHLVPSNTSQAPAALMPILSAFTTTAQHAQSLGLGVNAGHDLNLDNLALFLTTPNILEVSIGHAITVECLELGIETVMARYMNIVT